MTVVGEKDDFGHFLEEGTASQKYKAFWKACRVFNLKAQLNKQY